MRTLVQGGKQGVAGTAQAQVIIARRDVDRPRANFHAVGGLDHAQVAQRIQALGQQARKHRRHVLHQQYRHPQTGRKLRDQAGRAPADLPVETPIPRIWKGATRLTAVARYGLADGTAGAGFGASAGAGAVAGAKN